jgi:hypothetical protein
MKEPPRYTLYPATPTLSVDASQERLISVEEMEVAVRFSGVEGAVASRVVAKAMLLGEDSFPAAS